MVPDLLRKAGEAVREWLRDCFCRPCAFGRGALEACRGCRVLEAEGKAEELAGAVLEAADLAEMRNALARIAGMEPGDTLGLLGGAEVCPACEEMQEIAAAALRRAEGSGGGRAADQPGGEPGTAARSGGFRGGKRVYVSGPYAKGDAAENVRRAVLAADELLRAGHVPFCPHLSHFWHLLCPKPREAWLEYDLEWLRACDAVVRLPGESEGADAEVEAARELGIPVYGSVREFLEAEGRRAGDPAPGGSGARNRREGS